MAHTGTARGAPDAALRLLSVHPHPDDESIACGGVLARYAAEGAHVHVVTCTAGEEGDNLAGIQLGDEDLLAHRRRELADALAALGVTTHTYLGYRDSGMAGEPSNEHADSFHRADLDEAAVRLAGLIRRDRPQVVISDDEHGTYGHPDHVKAHRVTVRAVDLAADPDTDLPGSPWQVAKRYVHTIDRDRMLATHERLLAEGLDSPFGDEPIDDATELPMGSDPEAVTTVVDIAPWLDRKRTAMAAHRSQIGPDSFFLNLPDELVGEVLGVEAFILEAGPDGSGDGRETDLFAGLR